MRKAGGVIALIAGVLGLFAAAVTLLFGGIGKAFEVGGANTVIGLGWGGIFFCFLTIIFGAIAINAKTRTPGVLIVISSILGAVLGGSLVAILMVLAFVGGVLAILDPKIDDSNPQYEVPDSNAEPEASSYSRGDYIVGIVTVAVLLFVIVEYFTNGSARLSDTDTVSENKTVVIPDSDNFENLDAESDPLKNLAAAQASDLKPNGHLAELFSIGSDYTDLQRQLTTKEIIGRTVSWKLPVYNVRQSGNEYTIQTGHSFRKELSGDSVVGTFVHISPSNADEKAFVEKLKTGDIINIKGIISDVIMRNLEIKPAIFYDGRDTWPGNLLSQVYSRYNANYDCWIFLAHDTNQEHCMAISRTDKINVNGVDRYYLLTLGQPLDETGKPMDYIPWVSMGAIVSEFHDGEPVIIASNLNIVMRPTNEWKFVNLGPSSYWGWLTESGTCRGGECYSGYVILAPRGKEVINVASELPTSSESMPMLQELIDVGSDLPASSEPKEVQDTYRKDRKVVLKIDTSDVTHKVFPLLLTITDKINGNEIAPKETKVFFNEKEWKYIAPKNIE